MAMTDANSADFTVCHKSKVPARRMVAVRLGELSPPIWDTQLTLTCLQGLVNRESPCLYLAQDRFDELWLDWLVERGDVDEVEWLTVDQVFKRFLAAARGLVLVDTDLPGSYNVATMLAGIHGWLVATPALAQARGFLGHGDGELDLRTFGWQADVEAYLWFYGRYYDQLSHRMCAMTDPYDLPLRDYMVEFKIPLFWIKSAYSAEETAQVEELLERLPPNIPCLGWPYAPLSPDVGLGEHRGVILVNEYAKFEVCSGFETVSRAASNLSVHSGTTATFQHRHRSPPPLEDKVYVTFIRTDGDGANFYRECYRSLWEEASHGRFPMGWQQGPTMLDMMPDILDYFHTHATPSDTFVNALTGIGYIHEENYAYMYPPEQRQEIWQEYLEISRVYRERLGLSLLTTYHDMSEGKLRDFVGIGFEGIFHGYHRSFVTSMHNQVEEIAGVPVFRACNQASSVEANVDDIRRWTPRQRPAFMYASITNWMTRTEYVEAIIRNLGPEYVAVTPEQLVGLYWADKDRQQ